MKFKDLNRDKLLVLQFDLDGTLCTVPTTAKGLKDYANAVPIQDRINKVNELYYEGHLIKIETARGAQTDQDWKEFTKEQLAEISKGTQFSATNQPPNSGRRPKVFSQIALEFKKRGIERATPEAVAEIYEYILALPFEEINQLAFGEGRLRLHTLRLA